MSGIAGLRGTGNMGTDERPKNFREMILFRNPNGAAPIFGLTAKAKKKSTDDPEFSWWDEPNDLIRLQVNGAIASTTTTTVVVDSADPIAATPGITYGNATHLKQGDLLLVEPTTDNATFDHELLEVVSVSSDTTFTVKRGAGGTTAATISNDVYLTLIGSAYAEGSAAPRAVSRNPIKYYNYTQIFKNTYEITGTLDETTLRTGAAWSNDKKRKMFDHARDIELAMLFGRRHETTGEHGKPLRFMSGIRQQIASTNVTVFGSATTTANFLDAITPVFEFESQGGDERIAFCGNTALNVLNKAIHADTSTEINFAGPVKVYGMELQKYVTPQGTVYLKTHPLLNRHSLYKKAMFVLDFSAINYVEMKNRGTKVKDDVQTKDEDVRRGFIQTECSVSVDKGGLTCGYIGNFN